MAEAAGLRPGAGTTTEPETQTEPLGASAGGHKDSKDSKDGGW